MLDIANKPVSDGTSAKSSGTSPDHPNFEKPTKHGKFKRIEDKLILSQKQTSLLLEDINRYMKPSYLNEGTKFTLIASYYFDGPDLRFFHDHFLKAPKRYKLRIRRYAPNGVWSDEAALIELKSKELDISRKRRFCLTDDNYKRVMKGQTMVMTDELAALNSKGSEKLLKWMTKINGLIVQFGLMPSIKLQYKRFAFEADDGFRITIDSDLKIETLDFDVRKAAAATQIADVVWQKAKRLAARYERDQHCVVELKHTGHPPQWVTSFLKQSEIKDTSFSKYCWAVHETARPEPALPKKA